MFVWPSLALWVTYLTDQRVVALGVRRVARAAAAAAAAAAADRMMMMQADASRAPG